MVGYTVRGQPEATEARRAVAAHDFMVVKASQQPRANDQVGVAGTNAQQAHGHSEKRRRTNHTGGNGNGRRWIHCKGDACADCATSPKMCSSDDAHPTTIHSTSPIVRPPSS